MAVVIAEGAVPPPPTAVYLAWVAESQDFHV